MNGAGLGIREMLILCKGRNAMISLDSTEIKVVGCRE